MSKFDTLITFAKDLRRAHRFNRSFVTNLYRGIYPSYEAAAQALPSGNLQGFGHDVIVNYFEGEECLWKNHDYPAAFWLREALRTENTVFDLGGGWGQSYYAYGPYIDYRPELRWTVCDVEAFVNRGRKVAAERVATHLEFTCNPDDLSGSRILLTGGALQYLKDDLSSILDRLDSKPKHIIINRVPMYGGSDYYTIQRMIHSYAVYKIMNRESFIKRITDRGYELRDSWDQPRAVNVMFHPECLVTAYFGFYFILQ